VIAPFALEIVFANMLPVLIVLAAKFDVMILFEAIPPRETRAPSVSPVDILVLYIFIIPLELIVSTLFLLSSNTL
jgi:hypothetical protein